MKIHIVRRALLVLTLILLLVSAAGYYRWTRQLPGPLVELLLGRIQLPPGFKIQVYAAGVPNARSMALGPNGTVFVGSRRPGKVYALPNSGRKSRADEVITIARGLNMPTGVPFTTALSLLRRLTAFFDTTILERG